MIIHDDADWLNRANNDSSGIIGHLSCSSGSSSFQIVSNLVSLDLMASACEIHFCFDSGPLCQ